VGLLTQNHVRWRALVLEVLNLEVLRTEIHVLIHKLSPDRPLRC
jgi:hypothetical protein